MRRDECLKEARRLAMAYRAAMAVCRLPEGYDVLDVESLSADGLHAAGGSLLAVYGPTGEPVALPDLGEPTPRKSAIMARLERMVYGQCTGFDTPSGGWLTVYRSKTGYGVDRWPIPGGYSLTAGEVEKTIESR